jgi:hypothetical protein
LAVLRGAAQPEQLARGPGAEHEQGAARVGVVLAQRAGEHAGARQVVGGDDGARDHAA